MPYQRDAGLTETAALGLAAAVSQFADFTTRVQREGHFFVVRVETADGTVTLRDNEDWRWLQAKLEAN